jgi:hypothetical protein
MEHSPQTNIGAGGGPFAVMEISQPLACHRQYVVGKRHMAFRKGIRNWYYGCNPRRIRVGSVLLSLQGLIGLFAILGERLQE